MSNIKDINRYLKLINAEKLKKNYKGCIELYNTVGGLYTEIGSYDAAVSYHEEALALCETIGDQLMRAVTLRYIGEAKASLGNFNEAVLCIKRYLQTVIRLNNKVEMQRAATTLGRVYLMQAQESKDAANYVDEKTRGVAKEAEKKFQQALSLTDLVRTEVDEKEYNQMKSGLLINIALVKDILGDYDEVVRKFTRAIDLCKQAKLKDELYRCLNLLGSIYRSHSNLKMAIQCCEEALVIAKQIGKKILICEAHLECGLCRIWQRDFKNAKRSFAQAYMEKSPNEEDNMKAVRLTKLAHLIAQTHEQIREHTGSERKLKLCDKLGDLLVSVGAYKLAVEFYKRAYKESIICNKTPSEKAKILFSIAETYADDGEYQLALESYEKELELRSDSDEEQCQSLIKIAHMHEYLGRDKNTIVEAYEKAYAKTNKNPKLMYNVLKYYVPYMKKSSPNTSDYKKLESALDNVKTYREVIEETNKEDEEEAEDLEDEIANVDDIITDDDDDDEVMMIGRRRSTKKFKPNEVGEMPLHEACIKGDLKRVKSLISQGHEVNPRDNAGWTPLHEAANHGHYEIAEHLLEKGADVSNRGLHGMSPLHDAATNGHFEMMRLLIKYQANVIALTDSGETVLNCLRDYKKRYSSSMSDRELTEYQQMEIELINLMDKCGYNVMEENIKNLGTRTKRPSSNIALNEPAQKPQDKNPVREYREAINLKRKRQVCESPPEKISLPATFHTKTNTSMPTKQWLIDLADEEEESDDSVADEVSASTSRLWSVIVEGTEILVPSRETIKDLRELVAEIYSTTVGCKPTISLSIENNSNLKLLDVYKVMDVLEVGQRLIGSIDSWNLKPASDTYAEECRKLGFEPLMHLKAEMRTGGHLDLASRRYPDEHMKPLAMALMRRDFYTASLDGSTQFFQNEHIRMILDTINSWRFLRELHLTCVGLNREHFELICSTLKMQRLETIDLSFNAITYRELDPFKRQVENLQAICKNLKRLNMRKNHLWFLGDTNLSGSLDLMPLEVLASEQYSYSYF